MFNKKQLTELEIVQDSHKRQCELNDKQNEKIQELQELVKKLAKALSEINRYKLNSQRPGGSYSKSAEISFLALKELDKIK